MGLMSFLTGGGLKATGKLVETVGGVFNPNAEANSKRQAKYQEKALGQYAAEFHNRNNRNWFDSFADGLNRLVRPVIAISVFTVLPLTMIYPEHMAVALSALVLLPAGYWAMMTIVMSFFFGGRMQIKAHEMQKDLQATIDRAPQVINTFHKLKHELTPGAASGGEVNLKSKNAAIEEWKSNQS